MPMFLTSASTEGQKMDTCEVITRIYSLYATVMIGALVVEFLAIVVLVLRVYKLENKLQRNKMGP